MSRFDVGIRKYTENDQVKYWLLITAKVVEPNEDDKFAVNLKPKKKSLLDSYLRYTNAFFWKIFIIATVLLNTSIFIMYFWLCSDHSVTLVIILMHLTCFFYWTDFIGRLISRIIQREIERKVYVEATHFILDIISLLPLSIIYLLTTSNFDKAVLWQLRTITLLRFYRIPLFFFTLSTAERNYWKILMTACTCFFILFIILYANLFLYKIEDYTPIQINEWNSTFGNKIIVSLYYSVVITFDVAYGDIAPNTNAQRLLAAFGMIVGASMIMGIFPGIMATSYYNRDKRREYFRQEYEATMNIFKHIKVDKQVIEKIRDNMGMIWKYKKGFLGEPPVHILPLSIQKELYFDVNFGLLNRSSIFSIQPRSFLRSVSILMQNISFLPGDIIIEPFGSSDAMLCVASGVIEVLSEENDESVLFSLTTGTIIGEATLFVSIPARCVIRASTYVELQVLTKVRFYRLALTYREIFRSMRSLIYDRLRDKNIENEISDLEFQEKIRRKEMKNFLKQLREYKKPESTIDTFRLKILNMYVLSENIPMVKTLPLNLIRAKPWILRPNTSFTSFWNVSLASVVLVVVVVYPLWAAFYRQISPVMYVVLVLAKIIFLIDLIFECTTAIERKDHFTYITSIKEIIFFKLKTPRFYFDVLASYFPNVYAELIWPDYYDFGYLLLSLNSLLKMWCLFVFIKKLETDIKSNLLFVVTIKYIALFTILVIWASVLLYLEACFSEPCEEESWYNQMEMRTLETKYLYPSPISPIPASLYFAGISLFMVGYGDIFATGICDCIVIICCIIAGACAMVLCIAEVSSAFKHLARIRTTYQEEIFAFDRFMAEHEISKELQKKVRDYLKLQWNYDKGHSITSGKMSEVPVLQKRITTMELMSAFLTVPIFQKTNLNFIKLLVKLSQVRVLAPKEDIVESGTLAREMYILEKGYCQIEIKENQNVYRQVVGPGSPFGFVEMILGKVQQFNVRSLTHVRIISLHYSAYLKAVTKYPSNQISINEILESQYKDPLSSLKNLKINTDVRRNHLIAAAYLSKPIINVYKYQKTIGVDYWKPFKAWKTLRFFQYFLLPIAIMPESLFMKIWMSVRIINALLTVLIVPVQFFFAKYPLELLVVMCVMKALLAIDMYLMFHVGYYDQRGLLMFHPAKTAVRYLKGNFIIDLTTAIPYFLIKNKLPLESSHYNYVILYDITGFIIILQLYKFFQGFKFLEQDILRKTDKIKVLRLIAVTIILNHVITGFLVLLKCYNFQPLEPKPESLKTRLDLDYADAVQEFCLSYIQKNTTVADETVVKVYLITLYWVASTILCCGFGDISAYTSRSMIAVVFIIVLGVLFYAYMIANINASMVNTNILISKHRRRIVRMTNFMRKKNVSPELQRRIILHYEYNWQRTEGAMTVKIFTEIFGPLREKLVASMYEATLNLIPAFSNFTNILIRIIGENLDEVYFLRGEVIVRHNDIQEYIYLIYRGKVNLYNHNGALITSMGSGGLFGNISNKNFSLSSVVVVANDNVDVLRFDCKALYQSLRATQMAKPLIDYLSSKKEDYIEPKKEADDNKSAAFKLNLFQLNSAQYELATSGSIFFSERNSFYFRKNVFKDYSKPCCSFVILPESTLHKTIGYTVFITAYLSVILTMTMFSFQEYAIPMLVLSYATDVVFAVKIFLQFHISYSDKFGDCVISTVKIRNRYLKSKEAIYDILCNLPLDYIAVAVFLSFDNYWISILRLNRMIRFYYAFEYYQLKMKTLMVHKIYLQIGWLFVVSSLMIHILGCLWFTAACPLGHWQSPTWVTQMELLETPKWELYIYSIYHLISISTSAGMAVLQLRSSLEILLTVIFMGMTRIFLVLMAGLLTALINAKSLNLFMYQDRIAELKSFFRRQNISDYQMSKMWNYVTALWLSESGKQIPKFISIAPYAMKCEVMMAMFGVHLSQSYIFSKMDPTFLRQLAVHLKRYKFFQGNYIVQQGDIDQTMYFIHEGEVSVLTIHANLMETIHFTLIKNDNFGLKQGLVKGKPHDFSYRAETDVEILSLTLSHWKHLLKYFPQYEKIIDSYLQKI